MKSVKLSAIQRNKSSVRTSQNNYTIIRPWKSQSWIFKNKKTAMSFQAKLNKELTILLYEINTLTIELYRIHRELWAYSKEDLSAEFKNIDEDLNAIPTANNFYPINHHFINLFSSITRINKSLKATSSRLKKYNFTYHLATTGKLIDQLKNEYTTLGEDDPHLEKTGWPRL